MKEGASHNRPIVRASALAAHPRTVTTPGAGAAAFRRGSDRARRPLAPSPGSLRGLHIALVACCLLPVSYLRPASPVLGGRITWLGDVATAGLGVGSGVGWPANRPESPAPMFGTLRSTRSRDSAVGLGAGVGVGASQVFSAVAKSVTQYGSISSCAETWL